MSPRSSLDIIVSVIVKIVIKLLQCHYSGYYYFLFLPCSLFPPWALTQQLRLPTHVKGTMLPEALLAGSISSKLLPFAQIAKTHLFS